MIKVRVVKKPRTAKYDRNDRMPSRLECTVTSDNSTRPFKFRQTDFTPQTILENGKCVFHKQKLKVIDT